MRCLWLTRKYPRPVNSGELIYSDGLIRSFAGAGIDLSVIAHDNDETPVGNGSEYSEFVDDQNVNWRLGAPQLSSRLGSLVSSLPADAFRLKNGGPESILTKALAEEPWDTVIIDHAAIGWAMKTIEAHFPTGVEKARPTVIYISHNHEAKIRREIADESTEPFPKKQILKWDAEKYARLEYELCAKVDLVTAITETEVNAYRANFPDQEYACLTPGYFGEVHADHSITEAIPRRVVMTGSFEWIAKRMNLEIFLSKAAQTLADANIELQIVGKADPAFCDAMSKKYPTVKFEGRVPEMSPYLLNARMGLIVEELGGGFKLKQLDYIFHNLPIAGLTCGVDGLPMKSPDEILLKDDTENLMGAVADVIDDFDALNHMRAESFRQCSELFRWEDRGQMLKDKIQQLRKNQPIATTQPTASTSQTQPVA